MMPHRRASRLLIVAFVATLVTAQAGGSAAVDADVADPLTAQLSADELTDLKRVADAKGMSLEQAINDYAWQDDVAILATELEEKYPDEFAGAEVVDTSGREALIAFSGRVPSEAIARVEQFPLAHIRLVGERGHSVRELDERLEIVHSTISRRRDLVGDVSSTYDLETGAITVEVEPRDAARAAEAGGTSALISRLRGGLPAQAQEWVATIAVRQG